MWLSRVREGGDGSRLCRVCGPQGAPLPSSQGRWEPGGQWIEEGWDLAWVLTGTFWLLWEDSLGVRVGAGDQRGGNGTEHLERGRCHELEGGSLCKGWG